MPKEIQYIPVNVEKVRTINPKNPEKIKTIMKSNPNVMKESFV